MGDISTGTTMVSGVRTSAAAVFFSLVAPGVVFADPCEGPLPSRQGETFSGTVRYVGDGDGLCVGTSSDPATWIEVRLADFDAPELREPLGRRSRDYLVTIVHGREVTCTAVRGRSGRVRSYDRVIATCLLNGRRLGDLLRDAGAPGGGR